MFRLLRPVFRSSRMCDLSQNCVRNLISTYSSNHYLGKMNITHLEQTIMHMAMAIASFFSAWTAFCWSSKKKILRRSFVTKQHTPANRWRNVCMYPYTYLFIFLSFAADEQSIEYGRWKVSKNTLHLLEIEHSL